MDSKAPDAFRTISEVADELDLPQHVLRFWETRFRDIKPMKRGGGRRYYRPDDIDLLRGIRHLLYGEGYTIRGVQRILREQGVRFVQAVWQEGAPQPPHGATADEAEPKTRRSMRRCRSGGACAGAWPRWSAAISATGRTMPPSGTSRRWKACRCRASRRTTAPRMGRRRSSPRGSPRRSRSRRPSAPKSADLPPEPAAPAPAAKPAGLAPDDIRKLQSALQELGDCRKLIEAAVARTD